MMKVPAPLTLLALALFCAVVVAPFHPVEDHERIDYVFETRITASASGVFKLYFDDGAGLREALASATSINHADGPVTVRLRVPARRLRLIRVDPIDTAATVRLEETRVLSARGEVVRSFAPGEFVPTHEIDSLAADAGGLTVVTSRGSIDAQLSLRLDPPLDLQPAQTGPLGVSILRGLALFAVGVVLLTAGARSARCRDAGMAVAAWIAAHPGRAVAAAGLLATVVNCHPVLFQGRSFVSPNFSDGTLLLYPTFPTLPGYTDTRLESAMGSDVGAIPWQHLPYSMMQHRALLEHGEWPLWNRYNSCGAVLLGQGQSMFGDPLHVLTILADGAAWAWDAKYVIARALFAIGIGLVVLRLTRHIPAALLSAAAAPFVGFFLFRINHPANFGFCYAPWILFCWVGLVQATSWRRAGWWTLGLVGASWCVMNSGTAKEAWILLLGMHFTGLLILLHSGSGRAEAARRIAVAASGGVVLALLSAPLWGTFLDSLAVSKTGYDLPTAFQINPSLVLGLFDEIFYRPIHDAERVLNPSASFLVLFGVLQLAVAWRRLPRDGATTALALAALPPFAVAFGLVPPAWIAAVPLLGNIAHVDNTFSCVLIVQLMVLAGLGFRAAAAQLGTPEGRGDIARMAVILAAMITLFVAFTHTVHRAPFGPGTVFTLHTWGRRLPVSPFVWMQLALLPLALLTGAWAVRRMLVRRRASAAGVLVAATCLFVMLWRFGQHAPVWADAYVYSPATRVDLHARSPALDALAHREGAPWRIAGVENTLMPGWTVAYDLEGLSGPDAIVNPLYRDLLRHCGMPVIWDWRLVTRWDALAATRKAYDFLNVRWFVDRAAPAIALPEDMRVVVQSDLAVVESATPWPRAFFVDAVARYDTGDQLGQLVNGGDGRPFVAMQGAESAAADGLPGSSGNRTVVAATDYRLTANATRFVIEAPSPGIVALHEAWIPASIVTTIDGRRAQTLRVNHVFRGVRIDTPGRHEIEFRYRPANWQRNLALGGLGLVLLTGAIVGLAWVERRGRA